jgi:hypothetical protein
LTSVRIISISGRLQIWFMTSSHGGNVCAICRVLLTFVYVCKYCGIIIVRGGSMFVDKISWTTLTHDFTSPETNYHFFLNFNKYSLATHEFTSLRTSKIFVTHKHWPPTNQNTFTVFTVLKDRWYKQTKKNDAWIDIYFWHIFIANYINNKFLKY